MPGNLNELLLLKIKRVARRCTFARVRPMVTQAARSPRSPQGRDARSFLRSSRRDCAALQREVPARAQAAVAIRLRRLPRLQADPWAERASGDVGHTTNCDLAPMFTADTMEFSPELVASTEPIFSDGMAIVHMA